jgi:hypothetical protein
MRLILEKLRASQHFHPVNDFDQLVNVQEESSFVYDFPLLFQIGDEDDIVVDGLQVSLYGATLLFNLALGFHKQGHHGKGKEIQKALNLYRMTLRLLEELLLHKSAAASMLVMLALYNRANCHFELCDFILSQRCAAELTDLMNRNMSRLHNILLPGVASSMILKFVPDAGLSSYSYGGTSCVRTATSASHIFARAPPSTIRYPFTLHTCI